MMKTNKLQILALPIVFCWLMMTIFIDIIAVPGVFRNVSKLEEAGRVGMLVFGSFNKFEAIFAVVLFFGLYSIYQISKKQIYLVMGIVLLIWALMYNLYFTPQIIHFTQLINSVTPASPDYAVYQSQHAHFHTIYRYLDSTKLFMLLSLVIMLIRFEKKTLVGDQK